MEFFGAVSWPGEIARSAIPAEGLLICHAKHTEGKLVTGIILINSKPVMIAYADSKNNIFVSVGLITGHPCETMPDVEIDLPNVEIEGKENSDKRHHIGVINDNLKTSRLFAISDEKHYRDSWGKLNFGPLNELYIEKLRVYFDGGGRIAYAFLVNNTETNKQYFVVLTMWCNTFYSFFTVHEIRTGSFNIENFPMELAINDFPAATKKAEQLTKRQFSDTLPKYIAGKGDHSVMNDLMKDVDLDELF